MRPEEADSHESCEMGTSFDPEMPPAQLSSDAATKLTQEELRALHPQRHELEWTYCRGAWSG